MLWLLAARKLKKPLLRHLLAFQLCPHLRQLLLHQPLLLMLLPLPLLTLQPLRLLLPLLFPLPLLPLPLPSMQLKLLLALLLLPHPSNHRLLEKADLRVGFFYVLTIV